MGKSVAFLEEIGGLGSVIPPYQQVDTFRAQHSGGDENDFPDFKSLDPIGDMFADRLFPPALSSKSSSLLPNAKGFVTSRDREGSSLPQATIKRFVDAEFEGTSPRGEERPSQTEVDAIKKLQEAQKQIEQVP